MADDKKPTQNTEEDAEETPKGKDAEVDGKKKTKAKSKAKEVKEEEEESSDEEEHPGLYDKPLVIEGKRERKKTEFLVKDPDERKKPEPLQFNGIGDALGTMEVVSHEISQCTSFELKPLHKLLFGRDGRAKEIKKNIKSFNGFRIEEGTKEYENKKFGLEKFTNEGLKRLLEIFDLEKKGTREDYKERVFNFLLNPKESGKSLKALQKKNEKKAKKKAQGKGEKRKAPSKAKKSKTTKSKDKVEEQDDDDEDEKESDEEEEDKPEEPKKKKAKTETPSKAKTTPSKSKQKTPSKSKKEEKKETKAKKSPKSKSKPVTVKITAGKRSPKKKTPEKKTPEKSKKVVEIDESSSDDEPLSKKAKKQEPTNDELAKTVMDLLKGADLDQITVKSVSKEVFAKYPDFDLSEKKGFIKETIYSVIAGDAE